jgi:hypothetical protein
MAAKSAKPTTKSEIMNFITEETELRKKDVTATRPDENQGRQEACRSGSQGC